MMLQIIEKITKKSYESQNQNLRLFARIELPLKLQILQLQKPLFHQLKSAYSDVDNAILTLSSLVLAIDVSLKKIDNVNLKAIKLRDKNHKAKIKREKVLGYWAIVRTLKIDQNMSFRQITRYFQKYHKFEISHSTIQKTWNELENSKGEKNDVNE